MLGGEGGKEREFGFMKCEFEKVKMKRMKELNEIKWVGRKSNRVIYAVYQVGRIQRHG